MKRNETTRNEREREREKYRREKKSIFILLC